MPKQFSQKWKMVFYIVLLWVVGTFASFSQATQTSYIMDYKRSNLNRYKVISRNTEGNRWQIETDWKTYRFDTGRIVSHEYERVLFEKRKIEKVFQYDIDFESYDLDEEVETRILKFYTIEGRPDHDEVELIDFYSVPICGVKSAIIMLRTALNQADRAARAEAGYPVRHYYYDHIFINLEKEGEAVFYPDPLDYTIVEGSMLDYPDYNCQSGYITFE